MDSIIPSEIRQSLRSQMEEGLKALERNFSGLRTGRASSALLEPVLVEAYGGRRPLRELASISVPEARVLVVQVWDSSIVSSVDKAIQSMGLNPSVEGSTLRIILPELSQQRRQELVKTAKGYAEDTRVGLRNIRRMVLDDLPKEAASEDTVHMLKKDIQKITDEFIVHVDKLLEEKEQEILK